MKKILSLLLVLALLLGLTGCQASNEPDQTQITASQTETTIGQTETTAHTQATTQTTEAEVSEPPATQPAPKPEPTQPETQPQPTIPVETQPETQPQTQPSTEPAQTESTTPSTEPETQKSYTSKDEVALYIHEHGRLPDNFITKSQARALGWKSGSLEPYAPGKCIGGDRFYNRENLLPQGHTYYECDIDTLGKASRGAKRIVFSDDGLIYYTADHYRSFTLLYGEP